MESTTTENAEQLGVSLEELEEIDKARALRALEERRKDALNHKKDENDPFRIQCEGCETPCQVVPPGHLANPHRLCSECEYLRKKGWI